MTDQPTTTSPPARAANGGFDAARAEAAVRELLERVARPGAAPERAAETIPGGPEGRSSWALRRHARS